MNKALLEVVVEFPDDCNVRDVAQALLYDNGRFVVSHPDGYASNRTIVAHVKSVEVTYADRP